MMWADGKQFPNGIVSNVTALAVGEAPPPLLMAQHVAWDEMNYPSFEKRGAGVADAVLDCGECCY
jgi:hypothetical protein